MRRRCSLLTRLPRATSLVLGRVNQDVLLSLFRRRRHGLAACHGALLASSAAPRASDLVLSRARGGLPRFQSICHYRLLHKHHRLIMSRFLICTLSDSKKVDNVRYHNEHRSMNRHELKTILSDLRMSQATLSRLLDVTPRAVGLWLSGTRNVPGPVSAYVRLFASLPIGMQQAELAKHSEELKIMKNGMYLIEFAGLAGVGCGTLIFDDGRIYGADVAGAKYDGAYHFNEATGLVDVKIRVEMPAHQHSVVGLEQPFDWMLDVTTTIDPEKDSGQLQVQTNLGQPIVASYRYLRSLPELAA